ncbi:MAG: FAD-dependent oxidoreductase [Paludibaculum sp.]
MIAADLVVEAIGQGVDAHLQAAMPGISFSRQGTIVTKAGSSATSRERVYAAGDVVNGGATVVQAVAEGTRAAQEIHRALAGEPLVRIG